MIFKIASVELLEHIPDNQTISVQAAGENWTYTKKPGMLYIVARAVTADVPNGNGDRFSEPELRKAYKTFIGKGVFVNHASSDIEKKRGLILDAKWAENGNDKYVKCLLEINADAFPELARMIQSGHTTDLSMGCSVKYSTCSICNHKAASVNLYCGHIKHHKGSIYNGLPVFEDNHDIEFIELSIVSKAADSTAKVLEVLARKKGLDLQQVLQKAAADPMYADSLINNSDDSIERVVIKAIKRANQIRGTK
jgi:hypothetical protein